MMRSPHYRLVYANAFGFRLSASDFCLTIANNAAMPGAPVNIVQEEIAIMMPLPQLKILAEHLTGIVQAVEDEIGAIRVPEKSKASKDKIEPILSSIREAKLVF